MGDDLTRHIREALLADASPARRRDALAALDDVEALLDRYDRLEAAARPDDELSKRAVAVVDAVMALDPHVTQMMPTSVIVAVANLAAALSSPPKPLAVGDTVTRDDADRVPVGAILRGANGKAVEVYDDGDDGSWFITGYRAGTGADGVDLACWPMQVLWLPEDGDQ